MAMRPIPSLREIDDLDLDAIVRTHGGMAKEAQQNARRYQAWADKARKEIKRRKRDNKGKVNGAG